MAPQLQLSKLPSGKIFNQLVDLVYQLRWHRWWHLSLRMTICHQPGVVIPLQKRERHIGDSCAVAGRQLRPTRQLGEPALSAYAAETIHKQPGQHFKAGCDNHQLQSPLTKKTLSSPDEQLSISSVDDVCSFVPGVAGGQQKERLLP